jgi:nucleotide-binding universal stress UspA family protein
MKPKQPKRILIPTDFSKTSLLAVEHAAMITRLSKADLYLLHTVETPDPGYIFHPVPTSEDIEMMEKECLAQLNKMARELSRKYEITVKTVCKNGRPAYEIVETVKNKAIDLVIMGTHGAHGFNEFFIGSNAHKTVTICPCPVITVQEKAKKLGFNTIVLPIDDSFYSRAKVDLTIMIAKLFAAKVHILGLIKNGDDTDPQEFNIKMDSVEKAIKKAGLSYQKKIIKGENLAIAAMRYSKKVKADLISVLTNHESRLNGIFLNGFSKQIVNHSKIPVVSIRPLEGFYDSVSLAGSNSI